MVKLSLLRYVEASAASHVAQIVLVLGFLLAVAFVGLVYANSLLRQQGYKYHGRI